MIIRFNLETKDNPGCLLHKCLINCGEMIAFKWKWDVQVFLVFKNIRKIPIIIKPLELKFKPSSKSWLLRHIKFFQANSEIRKLSFARMVAWWLPVWLRERKIVLSDILQILLDIPFEWNMQEAVSLLHVPRRVFSTVLPYLISRCHSRSLCLYPMKILNHGSWRSYVKLTATQTPPMKDVFWFLENPWWVITAVIPAWSGNGESGA